MTSGIYTIFNKVNRKYYVGFSKNVKNRLKGHRKQLLNNKHVNSYLQKEFNIYGEENFEFELLCFCEEKYLSSEEHYWATLLNSHNYRYGYNVIPTNPNEQRKLDPVFVNKFVQDNKKIRCCEKCNKCVNTPNYYKYHGENCGKKYKLSSEAKEKISIANKNKTFSNATLEKIRIAKLENPYKHSEEARFKMINNKKKFKHSETTKLQMSLSHKGKKRKII